MLERLGPSFATALAIKNTTYCTWTMPWHTKCIHSVPNTWAYQWARDPSLLLSTRQSLLLWIHWLRCVDNDVNRYSVLITQNLRYHSFNAHKVVVLCCLNGPDTTTDGRKREGSSGGHAPCSQHATPRNAEHIFTRQRRMFWSDHHIPGQV